MVTASSRITLASTSGPRPFSACRGRMRRNRGSTTQPHREAPSGQIRVHEFISLDGVIDTPSWTFEFGFDPRMGEAIGAVTAGSDEILLGRKTYEMFEPSWSNRTAEEDPGARFFNDTTKYVVSSTLTTPTWRNSEIIGPYDPKLLQALKGEVSKGLYVSGSGSLVRAMIADQLVDELHLFVYPVTRGAGQRLFEEEWRNPSGTGRMPTSTTTAWCICSSPRRSDIRGSAAG